MAPHSWLAEYLHELTVFPNGKHDDQADSTAQFLDWLNRPFPSQGFYELVQMQAARLRNRDNPECCRVRLQAPAGIGAVQTFSGQHINVAPDGTIEMSGEDAQYYVQDGWTRLAEWTIDAPLEGETHVRDEPEPPKVTYAKGSMEWQAEQQEKTCGDIRKEESGRYEGKNGLVSARD
jgi:hypothetical protein